MMMQLGDPERALKGDDFYGMACRQVDHDRCTAAAREPDRDHDSGRDLVTQYGHAGRHHGIGTPGCPRELHHHHDERCEPPGAEALAERRQRAREAGQDRYDPDRDGGAIFADCLDEAIETATRVRITDEIMSAAVRASSIVLTKDALAAAFAAAGFEVEDGTPPVAVRKHESLCGDRVCFEDDFTEKCTCWCHEVGKK
jgi:hypothetical protein